MSSSKVVVRSLPIKTDGDEPRRIVQDRGELAILHPVGPVYNVIYFDIYPGEGNFRGGHFHKTKRDTLYVVSGRCEMRLLDLDTSELTTIKLQQGDMITIGPRCAHKLVAIEFSRVVEYSLDNVNYAEDTVPYELS